jgi:predicted deacylase
MTGCTRIDAGPPVTAQPDPIPEPMHASAPRQTVRTARLGYSLKGVPLMLHIYGNGPDTVFIFGGIHGSEPTSATLAAQFARYLEAHPEEWAGRTIAVLAETNPDGLACGSRQNANGVDLNRNFPATNWRRARGRSPRHGNAPASEPETRAVMLAVERLNPDRIISIHSIARGKHCNNFDGPAEELAHAMAARNRYPATPTMGYPTPGSFGNWAGIDRGIPTITLELPRDADPDTCWRENREALLAFIRAEPIFAE